MVHSSSLRLPKAHMSEWIEPESRRFFPTKGLWNFSGVFIKLPFLHEDRPLRCRIVGQRIPSVWVEEEDP